LPRLKEKSDDKGNAYGGGWGLEKKVAERNPKKRLPKKKKKRNRQSGDCGRCQTRFPASKRKERNAHKKNKKWHRISFSDDFERGQVGFQRRVARITADAGAFRELKGEFNETGKEGASKKSKEKFKPSRGGKPRGEKRKA